jgi:hypothetical protein
MSQLFVPTFLYIKQHSVTGMLYFGKTTRNPETYKGSGIYWKRHLKKHGEVVETLWYCLFYDKETCSEFAKLISKSNDIIKSNHWANLIDENGLDGAPAGHESFWNPTEEERLKLSIRSKKLWEDEGYRKKMDERNKKRWESEMSKEKHREWLQLSRWTEEGKKRQSEIMTGRPPNQKWLEYTRAPRPEQHKKNISLALSGKKSLRNTRIN